MTGPGEVSWPNLRRLTPARIGLRRTGTALTTADHLDFQLAHARARDAVYARLDAGRIAAELGRIGFDPILLRSAAADRPTYLRRPDLGRRLDTGSRQGLADRPPAAADLAFVVADGLSAAAVNAHAVALLAAVRRHAGAGLGRVAPVAVVEGGRVAIGDEIGGLLGVDLVSVLIGERPGLSSPDSLGVYLTWQPAPGTPDAARNCLSNIRPQGLPIDDAAEALLRLFAGARHHRMTGVALSRRLADADALATAGRLAASPGRMTGNLSLGNTRMPAMAATGPANADPVSLLGDGDPPPVRVLRPEGRADFLLVADHAGRAIPRRLGTLGLPESERGRHIAWDIGIAGVTEQLAERLDAAAVLQTYSRLVIDCNRRPDWDSSIPVISELTEIPGNRGLAAVAREARRRDIFAPYHRRIAEFLDARAAAGRRTVLVAMHSFTPVFKGERRHIDIGILYHRDARLAAVMLDLLRREGDLAVGDNAPYAITEASDYTVPVHGEGRGLPHVEIEIRQDLIGDAAGQAGWAARLARLLPLADARLRAAG